MVLALVASPSPACLASAAMIFDSVPWKAQLAKDAAEIDASAAKRPSAKRSLLIERNVFVGAYAIRKLDESFRLSSAFLDEPITVKHYPVIRSGYSPIRHPDFERFFAMEQPQARSLTRRRLLNVLIHSAVFVEVLGPRGRCQGVLVASDRTVRHGLYEVELPDLTNLMRLVAAEFPTVMTIRTAEDGTWTVWTGHDPPTLQDD
ncbi:hypothetical protein GGQ61_002176 [Phenylobacterium haematophilum]|uniref:Uncharacterized protein n=2 Tax=Phenylobacterium TaxID=20 RepID=A0A840A0G7_9CAUL|nr:hypothetical protein [Phenylobacterium haematophilum]MBB3891459.1 hypothetical protein [Phenylobacterium haematophilum]